MTTADSSGIVRVRFAPSPSGYLHTGSARTALFNWLWAQQAKRAGSAGGGADGPVRHSDAWQQAPVPADSNAQAGTPAPTRGTLPSAFILRVEDTNENRSTEASMRAILDSLHWLGLRWDEGPDPEPARFGQNIGPCGSYFQSERAARHAEVLAQLLAAGQAFYCPATTEQMTAPDGKKLLFSPYRDLTSAQQQEKLAAAQAAGLPGLPVRLKCPRGVELAWDDIVRGAISFQSDEIGDIIIARSNGQVLYNFAVTCDDNDMQITHVLRGEDHISNTPKQLLLYDALGWPRPVFGHVPLIVGMDRARLSKRHGATKVEAYRELGVLPEALFNFLLLIGWAPSGNNAELANKELFSVEEAIEAFDPRGIGRSAGAFNTEKLEYFNGLYIRALAPDAFFAALRPFLPADWLAYRGAEYARQACLLFQEKLTLLSEIEQNAWYFFRDPSPPDAPGETDYNLDSVEKFLVGNHDAPRIIGGLYPLFEALSEADWTHERLESIVDGFCEASGLGKGKVMQPWRVALTGDKMSPGFYELLCVLGREVVLRRSAPWHAKLTG